MEAIREIVKPINHKIIIELPEDFQKENEFEVIVFPINKKAFINCYECF